MSGFGSLFGSGPAQGQAAGNMFGQAASGYGALMNPYSTAYPQSVSWLTNAMNRGLSKQTYTGAMGRTQAATAGDIASARESLGAGVPNITGFTGDLLSKGITASADTSAQLGAQNQQFKQGAATALQQGGQQAYEQGSQGLAGIGQDYQQAAQQSGNPLMNFLSLLTGSGPGGSGGSSWLESIIGMIGKWGLGAATGGAAPVASEALSWIF